MDYKADEIRAAQGRQSITNEKLAELAGVNVNTITAVRRGNEVKVSTLKAVADALNIPMSDLFTEEVAA